MISSEEEGRFLDDLRIHYVNVPTTLTRDNVNVMLRARMGKTWGMSLLYYAANLGNLNIIRHLLFLGANTCACVLAANDVEPARLLLEAGSMLEPAWMWNWLNTDNYYEMCCLLIDYGCKITTVFGECLKNDPFSEQSSHIRSVIDYNDRVIIPRVVRCRKTLVATFLSCAASFKSIKWLLLNILKAMWCEQRGPDGCGPRGRGWSEGESIRK